MQSCWEILGHKSIRVAIERMQVQWDEMDATPDIRFRKLLDELIPRDRELLRAQTQHIQVPGMFYVCRVRRGLEFRPAREGFRIALRNCPPAFQEPVAARQLMQTN